MTAARLSPDATRQPQVAQAPVCPCPSGRPTRCHALEFQNRPMNETRSDLTPDASLLAGRDDTRSRALLRSGLLERAGETQFRLIAEHVRVMLDVPVALVTLVGSDRQFFAASPGLREPWASEGATPLDMSFCRHVVEDGRPVIVPDAHRDPDFCDNGAVEALGVVAYLGVPCGSAAVNWWVRSPRSTASPGRGRTGSQAPRSAGDLVMSAMAERLSDARWRMIFEQLEEAFILGRLQRDETGRVVDWVYEEVNRAWYALTGLPEGSAVGRSVRDVLPGIEKEWIDEFAAVVETGVARRFTRRVGTLGRWYEGIVRPVGEDRFTVIFLDVSDRLAKEEALRNNEARIRTLVDSMPIGVALAEAPSGRILIANRRLGRLLGVEPGSLPAISDASSQVCARTAPRWRATTILSRASRAVRRTAPRWKCARSAGGRRPLDRGAGQRSQGRTWRTVAAVVAVSDIEGRSATTSSARFSTTSSRTA